MPFKSKEQKRIYDREAAKRARRKAKESNDPKFIISDIIRTYNVDKDTAKQLYEARTDVNRPCEVCGEAGKKDSKGNPKQLNIDHNDKTGKVRGLLCKECNTGFGQYYEDIKRIQAGIDWLEKHS